MKVDIVMPKMGESITEGTLIKWYKKVGEKVSKDEIIFEISTDKVDTEIPSPEEGVLSEIKVFEQETVEVGALVAVLETDGEAAASQAEEPAKKETPSTTQVGGELIDVTMPKMGESIMEGTIIKWHKAVGDKIEKDEILFEISTDKVDTEVPSPVEGVLNDIVTGENETVEVGTVVARISTSGGLVKTSSAPPKSAPEKDETQAEQAPRSAADIVKPEQPAGDRFYSPLVMNIARKENISFDELETIPGSGASGRLTKKDVLDYLKNRGNQSVPPAPKPVLQPARKAEREPAPQVQSTGDTEVIPMDNIRQRIMYHMVNSRDTSVHVTAVAEVDMSRIYDYIQKNREAFLKQENVKLTYMPFISHAVIRALKEYPFLNASIDDNNIIVKKFINLGIAVAVEPNGLIVPNIKEADGKNIRGLAKAINNLSIKSRSKGLMPDDIMDGTFTITNYGVFGSLFGTPIINQPEVGILGVGAVTRKPVVVENNGLESIAIKPMMYLSLSHDHRLVDGMLGGKFLKYIKDSLESFDINLV